MAQTQRRRPMTREEALARQQRMQRLREKEEESRELARGPIDLPFCLLVILLTGIGLVMLLSASFPSAYYINGDPTHYFVRQGIFAIAGIAAMFLISHFNYQRLRPLAKPLLYLPLSYWCWWSFPAIRLPSPGITPLAGWVWANCLPFSPLRLPRWLWWCTFPTAFPRRRIRCTPPATELFRISSSWA